MRLYSAAILLVWVWGRGAIAHDVPVQLPPPGSAPEAWNVIEQSKGNISELIGANLMRDIGAQLANISVALRALAAQEQSDATTAQIHTLLGGEIELLHDSRDGGGAQGKTRPAWNEWCKALEQLEGRYPPDVVHAEVYICPMHPFDRHLNPNERCSVCGMALVRRHLPASGVYQKAGEPTMKLTMTCPPLVVGKPVAVVMHLSKADGTPVRFDDLIEVHTKKIHLLINDQSLSDYHHIHPVAGDKPGDYRFGFTPLRPGPYRVWADVVPADSGVQEYDIADLPATTLPEPISDKETRLFSMSNGLGFLLQFQNGGEAVSALQTVVGTITVTDSDGKGFTGLEPVMGAFAHLVGFSEDRKSVLHIHPYGREPRGPDDRAGPTFVFKFYAPAPGFLRLYCQVQVKGGDVFAPFNLNIESPSTQPTPP